MAALVKKIDVVIRQLVPVPITVPGQEGKFGRLRCNWIVHTYGYTRTYWRLHFFFWFGWFSTDYSLDVILYVHRFVTFIRVTLRHYLRSATMPCLFLLLVYSIDYLDSVVCICLQCGRACRACGNLLGAFAFAIRFLRLPLPLKCYFSCYSVPKRLLAATKDGILF